MNLSKVFVSLSLVLTGCTSILSSPETGKLQAKTPGCPNSPPQLSSDRVTEVTLQYQRQRDRGTATDSQALAYQFEGKAGQKLSYQTSSGLCVWVFAPDNELVETSTLPKDGKYLVQVSAEKPSTEFEIEMAIEPFDRSSFPKAECGDAKPSNPTVYPVNFHPVNLPYTPENLRKAKSLFCRDAYKKLVKGTNNYSIQVASFTRIEKAQAFARLLEEEFNTATVAEPTTLEEP